MSAGVEGRVGRQGRAGQLALPLPVGLPNPRCRFRPPHTDALTATKLNLH